MIKRKRKYKNSLKKGMDENNIEMSRIKSTLVIVYSYSVSIIDIILTESIYEI